MPAPCLVAAARRSVLAAITCRHRCCTSSIPSDSSPASSDHASARADRVPITGCAVSSRPHVGRPIRRRGRDTREPTTCGRDSHCANGGWTWRAPRTGRTRPPWRPRRSAPRKHVASSAITSSTTACCTSSIPSDSSPASSRPTPWCTRGPRSPSPWLRSVRQSSSPCATTPTRLRHGAGEGYTGGHADRRARPGDRQSGQSGVGSRHGRRRPDALGLLRDAVRTVVLNRHAAATSWRSARAKPQAASE